MTALNTVAYLRICSSHHPGPAGPTSKCHGGPIEVSARLGPLRPEPRPSPCPPALGGAFFQIRKHEFRRPGGGNKREPRGTSRGPVRSLPMHGDSVYQSPRVLTPEQRKARDVARKADAEAALRERAAADEAFRVNRERLKAARLARELAADVAKATPSRGRK
jgi:hypothetical protein